MRTSRSDHVTFLSMPEESLLERLIDRLCLVSELLGDSGGDCGDGGCESSITPEEIYGIGRRNLPAPLSCLWLDTVESFFPLIAQIGSLGVGK